MEEVNTTLFGFYLKQWSYAKSDVTSPLGYGLRLGFSIHDGAPRRKKTEQGSTCKISRILSMTKAF